MRSPYAYTEEERKMLEVDYKKPKYYKKWSNGVKDNGKPKRK